MPGRESDFRSTISKKCLRSFQQRSLCLGRKCSKRQGSVLILVLVVLALVGLLTYQSVRTLLVIHRGQSQQASIAQARELLDLAKQLEQSPAQKESIRLGQFFIILPVGEEYGKLELLPANSQVQDDQKKDASEQDGQVRLGPSSIWIAKTPVDRQGNEIPGRSPVVVSLERLSRK